MEVVDLAYAAGVIDGEGCINIAKNHKRDNYHLQVVVAMLNKEIPQRLYEYFGGTVAQYSRYFKHLNRHSHYWRWVICNRNADNLSMVEVIWVDAVKEEAHLTQEGCKKLSWIERRNVGYLVEDGEDKIVITWGLLNNLYKGEVGTDEGLSIPRLMIKEIKKLEPR